MQKHELLLKIRYQHASKEPLLSALAVEKALRAAYLILDGVECEITYQNDPYSEAAPDADIFS